MQRLGLILLQPDIKLLFRIYEGVPSGGFIGFSIA